MYDYKYGTVGVVALDKHGNLAAATSTGGMTNKRFGRVGDSSIVGAGIYANNQTIAVSATSSGEMFIRTSAAHNVHTPYKYVSQDAQKASDATIKEVVEFGGSGGLIILDAKGNYAFLMNSKGMHRGTIGPDGKPMTTMYGIEKLRHYSGKILDKSID